MSLKMIAETVGLGPKTVTAVVREAGMMEPKQAPVPEKPDNISSPVRLQGAAKLDAEREAVIEAIAEGLSGHAIACRFRVAEDCAYRWLRDNNLKTTPLTALQRKIIHLWRTTDLNKNAISKQIGCSRTNVTQALRRAGLEDSSGTYGRPRGSVNGKRAPVREEAPEPVLEDALA